MATRKMIEMVNRDKKLAVLFGGMVFDGLVLLSLLVAIVIIVL